MDLSKRLTFLNRTDYQDDNFSSFLKHLKFNFKIPSIHVTGTNGKGSTCDYIASILKESGYKVGLFTSPYFYEMNEMIKVNGVEISDNEVEEIIKNNEKSFKKFNLSQFEIQTFIAFMHFLNVSCDVVVVECGMGGLLDATNFITPILSVITSVSLEHTEFLGRTISEIATHKAGIIKREVPVVISEFNDEAETTISTIAKSKNSKIIKCSRVSKLNKLEEGYSFAYTTHPDLKILSNAHYSITDALIAVEVADTIKTNFNKINEESIKNGLLNSKVICRFEKIKNNLYIDGAHNPEAINALIRCINERLGNKRIHVIFASFRDKNIIQMLPNLSVYSEDITLTTFSHPRARVEDEYFLYLNEYKFDPDFKHAIDSKMEEFPDDVVLVTGSLAFAGIVRSFYVK